MKKLPFFIVLGILLFITSCGDGNDKSKTDGHQTKLKNSVILLYDVSLSNDDYALLNEANLTNLFYTIANQGGGKFYAILIKSNSRKQEVFEYDIPSLDTLELIGNMYQITKRTILNQGKKAKLNTFLIDFIAQCKINLLLPKTEPFTDLVGALKLAETTCAQPNIRSTNIHLIIISDGLNDLPPVEGLDKIDPFNFKGVNVNLIRPIYTEFIDGPTTIFNSINDCINNIK